MTVPQKIALVEKLALISEHWRPKVIGALNGQEVKLVKVQGTFPWHHHETEDEFFLTISGRFVVEFRDRTVVLEPGECLIVPHGTEHRTASEFESSVLIFEPAETRNTGNVVDATFTAPNGINV